MIYVKVGGDSDRFKGRRWPGADRARCRAALPGTVTAITQQAHGPGEQEDDRRRQSRFRVRLDIFSRFSDYWRKQ